jgi:hypothetical protein
MADAHQRDKLEGLCRYIARPATSEKRLSLTSNGLVRYKLKISYRNRTTHALFEPLNFITKLAALLPKPRVNLKRFHGVFSPRNKLRGLIATGKRRKPQLEIQDEQSPVKRRVIKGVRVT